MILGFAHLIADVIIAANVDVRPGPETEVGHEPLILESGIVSGLGVGPDCFVLANDVERKYEKFDVGKRFAFGKG